MRKLRVFYTRKLGRFVGRCVGLLGVLFLIVNLISCQDDFQENVEPPVLLLRRLLLHLFICY